jgi:hypothetical protein
MAVLPIGVVDEEDATGFELGQCRTCADGAIPAIDDHEIEPLMHYAVGQGVAWLRSRRPVAEIFAQLVEESHAALASLRR